MENSIEEAIKIMEHWIEYEKNNKEKINRADELINIQETILSAYKRVLKEKNRLEEQVEYDKTHIYTPQTIKLNFILKSKIEDKIEKLNSESYAEKLEDMMNTKNYTITELVQYVLQELLDGSDTDVGSIGNSIEDRINNAYCFLNSMHSDFRTGLYYKEDLENLEHILSDYKKVLKENEILKEEKEQAWEEWNNLEQGSYGTEQKLKQQIKELQKENEELNNRCRNLDKEAQAYLEELAGDNTLTRRTIKQLQEENEELKKDYYNVINKIENKIDILDIAISECIYIDDDDKAYKKAVKKDKSCLLNQKRTLQELLEGGQS